MVVLIDTLKGKPKKKREHGKLAYKTYRKEVYRLYKKKLPKWDKLDKGRKEIWEEVWFVVCDAWAHSVLYNKQHKEEIKGKLEKIRQFEKQSKQQAMNDPKRCKNAAQM